MQTVKRKTKKQQIIELLEQGLRPMDIVRQYGFKKNTVYDVYKEWKKEAEKKVEEETEKVAEQLLSTGVIYATSKEELKDLKELLKYLPRIVKVKNELLDFLIYWNIKKAIATQNPLERITRICETAHLAYGITLDERKELMEIYEAALALKNPLNIKNTYYIPFNGYLKKIAKKRKVKIIGYGSDEALSPKTLLLLRNAFIVETTPKIMEYARRIINNIDKTFAEKLVKAIVESERK